MSRHTGWMCWFVLWLFSPAGVQAAPSYTLTLNSVSVRNGTTPVEVDSAYSSSNSFQTMECAATLTAVPGVVRTITTVECRATSAFGVSGSMSASTSASANDFLITGPPGVPSVTGTFYFSINGKVELTGGYPNNNGHQGIISFGLRASSIIWLGQWARGNGSAVGSFGLAGYPGPDVGTVIGLAGSFPVGVPFLVSIDATVTDYFYGNLSYSPMLVRTVAADSPLGPTMSVGDLTGLVMALPAGYTASSASWNVVDNHFLSPVLDAPPGRELGTQRLALVTPNPGVGPARLSFTLARAENAELLIVDAAGRKIRTLSREYLAAGTHEYDWDGSDDAGRPAAPGVFFARLQAEAQSSSVRLVRLR